MRALFGEGLHPDADVLTAQLIREGVKPADAVARVRLGSRFMTPSKSDDGWVQAVGAAYREFREEHGRTPEAGIERDMIRWNVARELLAAQSGKTDLDDAVVMKFLANIGRQPRQPVAGYDLVFTPVKSFSVLWILADRDRAEALHRIHQDAVTQTLDWVQTEAGKTRVAAAGVAQMDTDGLTVTLFEHFDSRSGDPNLHTHAAVSTKVRGVDGKWRSLDGRILHNLGVAASERYNMLIQVLSQERLGLQFEDVSHGENKRPVAEIAGVDRELCRARSSRRVAIENTYKDLVADYVSAHGHTPPRKAQIAMMQKANLATRQRKETPRSLTEIRATEREFADSFLGVEGVAGMLARVFDRGGATTDEQVDDLSVEALAARVVSTVEAKRSTWRVDHVEAEANRVCAVWARTHPGVDVLQVKDQVVEAALSRCVSLSVESENPVPDELRLASGESIYRLYRGGFYTSNTVLEKEDALVSALHEQSGFRVERDVFDRVRDTLAGDDGVRIDESQTALARHFASSGATLAVGIGPAGSGKTTSMRLFARTVEAAGGRVIALAPTASSSSVLGAELDVRADTAAKMLQIHTSGSHEQKQSDAYRVDDKTVLLVDEAGIANLDTLHALYRLAVENGASLRLIGDHRQLSAIEAGGTLRLLANDPATVTLTNLYRFKDQEEAAATLKIREGHQDGLDFYVVNNRVHGGLREILLDDLYTGFERDEHAGLISIMAAGTNEEVSRLNQRAQAQRVTDGVVRVTGVQLADGNVVGVGDRIVTRKNNRLLRSNRGKDFVANGHLWSVTGVNSDGSVTVKHATHGGVLTLPHEYVAEHVQLGYATTITRTQGMTVDTTHTMVAQDATSREQLYVGVTRGRERNDLYVITDDVLDIGVHSPDWSRDSIRHGLERVLARETAELSATETWLNEIEHAESLAGMVPAYNDAVSRVINAAETKRFEALIRTIFTPDTAEKIITDPAWVALQKRLIEHENTGADLAQLLRDANAHEHLDDTDSRRSLTKILHYRIGTPSTTAPITDPVLSLPAWVQPTPPSGLTHTEVRDWAHREALRIHERIQTLTNQAITTEADWLEMIPRQPVAVDQARRWRTNIERIVAYRDHHRISDPAPLGLPRTGNDPAFRDALAALRELERADAAPQRANAPDIPVRRGWEQQPEKQHQPRQHL